MTLFNVTRARRIASGFFPDPTICERPEGGYLMVNSSFEFFPGLPVWESDDGGHWMMLGHAMDRPSQFPYDSMGNSQGIYAPTLRCHDGTYYLIVTNVNRGNMILTTRDPHAGWSDPIWVEGWPGIDPSLFFDDDGAVYICGNEGGSGDEEPGIYLARIDPDRGRVLTGRTRICGGITGSNPEGPHLYRRGGMYYLMWAEGGTESGHMENIARAADPFGPYEMYPGNPLITNRSTHLTLQAIGHCDCAHFDADRTLMVFHGTRNNDEYPAQGWLGREPYAVWFDWGDDGWPRLSDQSYDTPLEGDGSADEDAVSWITPGIDADRRYWVMAPPRRHHVRPDAVAPAFAARPVHSSHDDGGGAPEGPLTVAQSVRSSHVDGPSASEGPLAGVQTVRSSQDCGPGASEGPLPPVREVRSSHNRGGGASEGPLTGARPVRSSHADDPSAPEGPPPATITVDAIDQDFSLQAGPPLIGTRQTRFRFRFMATLPDPGQLALGEAGIAAYANADHYLTVAVHAAVCGRCRVEASVHNAGLVSVVGSAVVPAGRPVGLMLRGDERGYAASVASVTAAQAATEVPGATSAPDASDVPDAAAMPDVPSAADAPPAPVVDETDLGRIPGKVLSFSNAGGFTGTLLGVYAHGTGAVTFTDVTYAK